MHRLVTGWKMDCVSRTWWQSVFTLCWRWKSGHGASHASFSVYGVRQVPLSFAEVHSRLAEYRRAARLVPQLLSAFRDNILDKSRQKLGLFIHIRMKISHKNFWKAAKVESRYSQFSVSNVTFLGDTPENFGIISAHEPRRQTKPPLPCVIYGWRLNKEDQNYRKAIPSAKYELSDKISSLAVSDCGQFIGIGCHNGDVQCLSSRGFKLITRNIIQKKLFV